MIQIQKRDSQGNIVPIADVDYTVETNFNPKGDINSKIINCLYTPRAISSWGADDGDYMSTTAFDGIISFTQQVYNPFSTGSLVLKNRSKYSFGAIDLGMNMDYTNDPTGVISVADTNLGWINSTDSFRGAFNPEESFFNKKPTEYTAKLVFDFHVDAGVGEINEIEFYSKPVYYDTSSSSISTYLQKKGAYIFTAGCMSFVDTSNSLELGSILGRNPYSLDFKIDNEGTIYRVYNGNSSYLYLQVKKENKDSFELTKVYDKLKSLTYDGTSLNFNANCWKLEYIAGQLYFIGTKSCTVSSFGAFNSPRYFVPITNIIPPSTENPDGDIEFGEIKEFKFTEQSKLPLGWVNVDQVPSLTSTYNIGTSITLNDKHYLVLCGNSRKTFAFVEITEDLEIVKSHTAIIGTSSFSMDGAIRIYPYYDTKSGELFINIPSDYEGNYDNKTVNIVTFRISSDLDSATLLTKSIWKSLTNTFIRYPHIDKVYTVANINNPTNHEYKFHTYGGDLRCYYFGEVVNTTATPMIRIKLNSPIVKNKGEFLKITLNVNISS